jgi:hypothetical protein
MTKTMQQFVVACVALATALTPTASIAASTDDLRDLVGARASGAENSLESRGSIRVDGFQSGSDGKGTIWWNGRTRQCLQAITVDGRVDSLSDIGSHRRCR